ncbi:3-hydroxyisobutyrate dehydrogenase [Haloferula luteola]|uniref:3-hydroxyisobutyrate dehydrogenase n=1 Tax=Haloferula luteola TaxID=595692 RepID=A0A840V141_9BACT|nr:NAD(P)-dependent oxidoreductase [Haloferula luteola]MBB5350786.1 3-hydroxyisobutyrate dehydrogenase [Haloferula luteola]
MTAPTPRTVGIIGLGIIGAIWARHYHQAGALAGAWNRTAQPDFPCWQDHPAEVARAADAIQIVVADPAAVQSVLDAILPALDSTKVVIQSSTIDPDSSETFQRQITATGARYLEAPFTGSKPAAEAGKTVFYLGGDPALCRELEPLLSLVSETRMRIGIPSQACALKLSMNLNISAQMEALCEAHAIATAAGIADDVFFQALSKNASRSGLSDLKEPLLRAQAYPPMFSVKHMHKDMRLASGIEAAKEFPVLAAVTARLAQAEARGLADEDFAALRKLL